MRLALLLLSSTALAAPNLTLKQPSLVQEKNRQVWHAFVKMQAPPTLESRREIDRLRFFSAASGDVYSGAGLFAAAVVAAAHAPGPLRPLFDRAWHLGPALLDGGGLGAGLGGRF
jgi:hypothetical protein